MLAVPIGDSVRVATTGLTCFVDRLHPLPPPRLEAVGREAADVPVDALRRPLLDDRRVGGLGCLLGQASLAIDQTESDDTIALATDAWRDR